MVEIPSGPSADSALSPLTDATLSRLACEHLLREGHPARPLLRAAGLPVSVLDRPETVGAVQQASFLELAARELGDDLLGFHLASSIDGRVFGPFFHLLASCADLGEALAKQARYLTTVNRALRCHVSGGGLAARAQPCPGGVDRALAGQEMTFWVTFMVQMARTLTTLNLVPAGVSFAQGDPVGASRWTITSAASLSSGRPPMAWPSSASARPAADAQRSLPQRLPDRVPRDSAGADIATSPALTARVSDVLASLLAQGQARLITVAGEFGMSARTLGRRLARRA